MQLDVNCYHPKVDDFPIGACPEMLYSSYTTAFFFSTTDFFKYINGGHVQFNGLHLCLTLVNVRFITL